MRKLSSSEVKALTVATALVSGGVGLSTDLLSNGLELLGNFISYLWVCVTPKRAGMGLEPEVLL